MLAEYANRANVTLASNIAGGVEVRGRAHEWEQVIMNLVKNAVDYNKIGGTVQVTLREVGSDFELVVADTGSGIPASALPYIFDRFYKVDRARTTHSSSGAGLGLAIVKEIVTRCHGTISVASREGQGTTFTIVCPLS